MGEKDLLMDIYRTLATLDEVLRTSDQTDSTKLYWVGRAMSEMATQLRPICEPTAA